MYKELFFHIVFSVVSHHGLGLVNFALHKSAMQSTTYNGTFLWSADKAVDGNRNGNNPGTIRTCSATYPKDSTNHTWEVDIGLQIIVKTITVYGRTDRVSDQLYGVKLYLSNTSWPRIYNQEIPSNLSNNTYYVFMPNDVIAQVIFLMRTERVLTICEVIVEGGCLDGTYSQFCNKTCGKCLAGQPCNKETGTCPLGCNPGWNGTLCEEVCERGHYGFNCNETCGNCLNGNISCSIADGNCSNGCKPGWQGYDCKKVCETGKYGFNCNETCGNCLNGKTSCSTEDGNCSNGCTPGWQGDNCKKACRRGTYGFGCNETCGNCYQGNISCSLIDGRCMDGCEAGWHGDICKLECEAGTYGFNCNETCGHCLNGHNYCSKIKGQCSGGCKAGWSGETCKSGTLGSVTPVDVGPNAGVIVGSVLAAVGVSIFAMVIITVIVKNRRKRDNNKTSTQMVTTTTHYANLVVGNPDAACKITVGSRAEKKTTFSDIVEANLQNGMPTVPTDSHSGIKELDVPVHNDYEKLRDVTGSTEAAYSTIDHSFTNDQRKEFMENCSNYVETLQSLESALKSVEEEISVLLDRKEKLLCKELERAKANKLRDKRKKKDCTQSDRDNDYTDVNDQRIGDLEHCNNYVQMWQSLEAELRLLEEKRKCVLERKENLLR